MLMHVLTTSGLVLVVWIVAWFAHRRYKKRMTAQFEACECAAITNRAVRMHHAVDTKLAAQDSRSDSNPLSSGKPEDPPTEELPPIA